MSSVQKISQLWLVQKLKDPRNGPYMVSTIRNSLNMSLGIIQHSPESLNALSSFRDTFPGGPGIGFRNGARVRLGFY